MDDRENLCIGLGQAAWGYFLLTFDITLGPVSILPQFAGFLLLYFALNRLAGERRDLLLLKSPCLLLTVYHLADWLLSWLGAGLDGRFMFLDLPITVAGLYFHFQFLTDMAALAEKLQPPGSTLDRTIRQRRTVFVAQTTLFSLLSTALPPGVLGDGETRTIVIFVLGLIGCIVVLSVMFSLFSLRRCVKNAAEA